MARCIRSTDALTGLSSSFSLNATADPGGVAALLLTSGALNTSSYACNSGDVLTVRYRSLALASATYSVYYAASGAISSVTVDLELDEVVAAPAALGLLASGNASDCTAASIAAQAPLLSSVRMSVVWLPDAATSAAIASAAAAAGAGDNTATTTSEGALPFGLRSGSPGYGALTPVLAGAVATLSGAALSAAGAGDKAVVLPSSSGLQLIGPSSAGDGACTGPWKALLTVPPPTLANGSATLVPVLFGQDALFSCTISLPDVASLASLCTPSGQAAIAQSIGLSVMTASPPLVCGVPLHQPGSDACGHHGERGPAPAEPVAGGGGRAPLPAPLTPYV